MPTIIFADPHIIGETIGGAEVQLWMLAKGFSESGWDVHYVTDAKLSETQREGVRLHSLFSFKSDQHRVKFFTTLQSINPDVIYQRGRKSYSGLVGKYVVETGTPSIFATSMDIDCRSFKEVGRMLRQAMSFTSKLRLLSRRAKQDISSLGGMKKASLILTQSELQQNLLKKNLSMESVVFRNLHQVPDPSTIEKDDPPLVLWLASVKQWKRPEIFIELAELLKEQGYHFILAGRMADHNQYESMLHDYEKSNPNFDYIEEVDLEQSNQLIARATIFVNTSEPFEGFPNTFIQSWLRRTLVLSLVVDPDELILKHGLGVMTGDLGTMADRIVSLLGKPEKLAEMGEDARRFAIKEFGLDENFSHFESIARDLIEKSKGYLPREGMV